MFRYRRQRRISVITDELSATKYLRAFLTDAFRLLRRIEYSVIHCLKIHEYSLNKEKGFHGHKKQTRSFRN